MSNNQSLISAAVQSFALPEVASRQQWTDAAKALKSEAATAGVFGANDTAADFRACLSMAYSLLISAAVHNDKSGYLRLAKAAPTNAKGKLSIKVSRKLEAFKAAENAGCNLFSEYQSASEIPAAKLFESLTLHAALTDILPQPAKPKTIAAEAVKAKVSDNEAAAAAKAETAAETAAAAKAAADQAAIDNAVDWPAKAEAAELAWALQAEAEAAEAAKIKAAEIAAIKAYAERQAAEAAAAEADKPAKIIQFCRLADSLGIKLTAGQKKALDAIKAEAAAA